jgi:hypothetical protein
MARIRSLKPEFWADEDLADLPRDARLLYMGLWNLSDEHGRLRGDARYVKGQLFPYDDDLDATAIDNLLWLLAKAGKVQRYEAEGRSYLFLPTLSRHQRLEPDKVESKLPPAPVVVSESSQPKPRPDESAPDPDESASREEDHALLYGTGSMEHGSGSMVVSRDSVRAKPASAFERFWVIYPRRTGKITARKAWDRAIKFADGAEILAGAERYRDDPNRDPQFTKHPETWLNAGCWNDEPLPPRSNGMREVNGLRLSDRTIENLEREKRLTELDEQRAIGGGP